MNEWCVDCAVGSNSAVLLNIGDETLCTNCADGHCERCGTATEHTTIACDFIYESCQEAKRRNTSSREQGQSALGDFT
jgi:hypothetical protein